MKLAYCLAVATAALSLTCGIATAAGLQDENLLVSVPDTFVKGYAASNAKTNLAEFVPKGQTVDDWTDMITVRVDHGMQVQPAAYAQAIAKAWEKGCSGGTAAKVKTGEENGYPFALWLFICPLNPATGKPETMTMKAMLGQDALYQVQYASRKEADADVVQAAASYLRTISVCDTRKKAQACPKGM